MKTDKLIEQLMEEEKYLEIIKLGKELGDDNSDYGFLTMGWIFDEGKVGSPDKNLAKYYYEKAITAGNIEANRYLGLLLLEQEEFKSAREAFERGKALNDSECNQLLSQTTWRENEYLAEEAINSQQYPKALELLYQPAKEGSVNALNQIGWLYHSGPIEVRNLQLAKDYYWQAIEHGSVDVYSNLGLLLLEQGDVLQAKEIFLKGAEAGDIVSMNKLGNLLNEHDTSKKQGAIWLKKAANQGHLPSQKYFLKQNIKNNSQFFSKLSAVIGIIRLTKKVYKEAKRNPNSDKIA